MHGTLLGVGALYALPNEMPQNGLGKVDSVVWMKRVVNEQNTVVLQLNKCCA